MKENGATSIFCKYRGIIKEHVSETGRAALIIFAAYLMGCQVCALYQRRVRCLEEIILGLEMFRAEVNYGLTPCPGLSGYRKKLNKPVGPFFDFSSFLRQEKV